MLLAPGLVPGSLVPQRHATSKPSGAGASRIAWTLPRHTESTVHGAGGEQQQWRTTAAPSGSRGAPVLAAPAAGGTSAAPAAVVVQVDVERVQSHLHASTSSAAAAAAAAAQGVALSRSSTSRRPQRRRQEASGSPVAPADADMEEQQQQRHAIEQQLFVSEPWHSTNVNGNGRHQHHHAPTALRGATAVSGLNGHHSQPTASLNGSSNNNNGAASSASKPDSTTCHRPHESGVTPAKLAALSSALSIPVRQLQRELHRWPALLQVPADQLAHAHRALRQGLGLPRRAARLMLTHHPRASVRLLLAPQSATPPQLLALPGSPSSPSPAAAAAAGKGQQQQGRLSPLGALMQERASQLAALLAAGAANHNTPSSSSSSLTARHVLRAVGRGAPSLLTRPPRVVAARILRLTTALNTSSSDGGASGGAGGNGGGGKDSRGGGDRVVSAAPVHVPVVAVLEMVGRAPELLTTPPSRVVRRLEECVAVLQGRWTPSSTSSSVGSCSGSSSGHASPSTPGTPAAASGRGGGGVSEQSAAMPSAPNSQQPPQPAAGREATSVPSPSPLASPAAAAAGGRREVVAAAAAAAAETAAGAGAAAGARAGARAGAGAGQQAGQVGQRADQQRVLHQQPQQPASKSQQRRPQPQPQQPWPARSSVLCALRRQPDLLLLAPRVLRNKLRALQCVLDRPRRLAAPLLLACPALARRNLDAVRAAFEVLRPITGRDQGFTFGMVCHAPALLLEHPQTLASQALQVRQAVRQVEAWRAQLVKCSPAQAADLLGRSAPTYARLAYLVHTQQAHTIGLHAALSMPRSDFLARYPDAASSPLMAVAVKKRPLARIPRWKKATQQAIVTTTGSSNGSSSNGSSTAVTTSRQGALGEADHTGRAGPGDGVTRAQGVVTRQAQEEGYRQTAAGLEWRQAGQAAEREAAGGRELVEADVQEQAADQQQWRLAGRTQATAASAAAATAASQGQVQEHHHASRQRQRQGQRREQQQHQQPQPQHQLAAGGTPTVQDLPLLLHHEPRDPSHHALFVLQPPEPATAEAAASNDSSSNGAAPALGLTHSQPALVAVTPCNGHHHHHLPGQTEAVQLHVDGLALATAGIGSFAGAPQALERHGVLGPASQERVLASQLHHEQQQQHQEEEAEQTWAHEHQQQPPEQHQRRQQQQQQRRQPRTRVQVVRISATTPAAVVPVVAVGALGGAAAGSGSGARRWRWPAAPNGGERHQF